jgi:glycosyltransferase involved in cell wall biosynthesis
VSELLSIVVPVYNERATISSVIDRLMTIDLPIAREIIVVNDGSQDGTREILDEIAARLEKSRSADAPPVTVIHADVNRGKGNAVRLGFGRARGTIVAIQDADLELDPAQLAELIAPIVAGETAVVYGSRFLAGTPPAPRVTLLANRALTAFTNLLFGGRLTDMETCYKIMRIDVARSLNFVANRFDMEPEITAKLLKAGHTIVERPVRFSPRSRAAGKKIGWRDGVTAVRVLMRERTTR